MGLGNSEPDSHIAADDVEVDEGGGGGGGKGYGSVSCSICLDWVSDNGDRSWAKLQCGHQFHLDCIGSAFNAKGVMQCPNCRKIEKGQWLFANGTRSLPEFSIDDWGHEEDLYDLGYPEMSFGVHWCPFGSLSRLHPTFEEGEFSSNAYHDLLRQHAIFAEHTAAVSTATHSCPYIAYFGPLHPSSSNSSTSVSDGSTFHNQWNGPSVPNEIPGSYAFPAMDVHYHSWEHHHHSPPFSTTSSRIGSADQQSIPPVTQRSGRTNTDLPRSGSFMHPFLVGPSSGARAGTSGASMVPPYQGSNARARDRVQALQAYYQQQPGSSPGGRAAMNPGNRRSSSHRGLPQVGAAASSSDQTGFYFAPPSTSTRNFLDVENPTAHFRTGERDHLPSLSSTPVDRYLGWGVGVPDPGNRSGTYRQRHGSERMPSSQNRS